MTITPIPLGHGTMPCRRDPDLERAKAEHIAKHGVTRVPPGKSGIWADDGGMLNAKRRQKRIGKKYDIGTTQRVDRAPILALWTKGESVANIARATGCSEGTVRNVIRERRGKR